MGSKGLQPQEARSAHAAATAQPPNPWAAGDLDRFARRLIWELGPVLVQAAAVGRGQRVLDVAAGTGNVALRAAEAGAEVVASDLVPAHFEAGRRNAARLGLAVEWREADAQALPFADGEFDVVLSSLGAMFAPDHEAVAGELARVCRPGGVIGMANFTPEGLAGEFFGVFGPWMSPPPKGAPSPLMWGSETHVQALLGPRVDTLETRRLHYVEHADSPAEYCEFYLQTFGPAVAIREALAAEPERAAAFERDFLDFATRANRGAPGGTAAYPFEYLLVLARR